MRDLPFEVDGTVINEALISLGIPLADVQSVLIDSNGITVTRLRRNAGGDLFRFGNNTATEVTHIRVVRS